MQIANDEKLNNIHTIHVDYIRKRSMMIKKREKKIQTIQVMKSLTTILR